MSPYDNDSENNLEWLSSPLSHLRIFQMLDYSPSHLRYETAWDKKAVVGGLERLVN
jgi:hypothetical protein